jgi:hypothetical protein
MVRPSVGLLLPPFGSVTVTVTVISECEVNTVVVVVLKPNALFFVASQHCCSLISVIIIGESAMWPIGGMIGPKRLSDIGALFLLEFFRTGQCPAGTNGSMLAKCHHKTRGRHNQPVVDIVSSEYSNRHRDKNADDIYGLGT